MKTLLELLDFEAVMEAFESPGLIAGLIAGAVLRALHGPAGGPLPGMHAHLAALGAALARHTCG